MWVLVHHAQAHLHKWYDLMFIFATELHYKRHTQFLDSGKEFEISDSAQWIHTYDIAILYIEKNKTLCLFEYLIIHSIQSYVRAFRIL